jgi:hypothetical protein
LHLAPLLHSPRAVAAVEAAGGGAKPAMMGSLVAGDTADNGALDAAFGVSAR